MGIKTMQQSLSRLSLCALKNLPTTWGLRRESHASHSQTLGL